MAKPGRFPMTDSAGAPQHSLGHRQGFVADHRLQRGARALLGGRDGGLSLSGSGQHLDGKLLQPPVTLGPAHDDEPSSRAPRGSRLAASSAAKSILKANS
jgi:hypothetical protein